MKSVRQLGSGLVYAVVSVVLVVGGLSLALAEGSVNAPPPTVKPSPTLFLPSATVTPTVPTATGAAEVAGSSTPQVMTVTVTAAAGVTQQIVVVPASATLRPLPTSTRVVYATAIHCGAYSGWIKSYVVQPGDTLFHISTLYRTTVNALQVANCKQNTIIIPGELLWVPNVATSTPGVTIIPTFTTPTETETPPPPTTPIPAPTETPTPTPTDTSNPDPEGASTNTTG